MFKDKYNNELDNIVASDDFKKQTIAMLQQRQEQLNISSQKPSENIIKFPYKKALSTVACICIFGLTVYGFYASNNGSFNPKLNDAMPQAIRSTTDDSVQTYNIDDAQPFEYTLKAKSDKTTSVMSLAGQGDGTVLAKTPADLNSYAPWDIDMNITNMPIYTFSLPSLEVQLGKLKYIENILNTTFTDVTFDYSYTDKQTSQFYMATTDDVSLIPKDIITVSISASNTIYNTFISCYDDNVNISFVTPVEINSSIMKNLYSDTEKISSSELEKELAKIINEYNRIFKFKNLKISLPYYYAYNGTKTYKPIIYNKDKTDICTNIFNYSFCNSYPYVNDEGHLSGMWLNLNTTKATQTKEIINPYQAMYMLYQGDFSSLNNSPITNQSEISYVDLIYKSTFNEIYAEATNYDVVPMYRFYVEVENSYDALEDFKTYAIYYVNAIAPN